MFQLKLQVFTFHERSNQAADLENCIAVFHTLLIKEWSLEKQLVQPTLTKSSGGTHSLMARSRNGLRLFSSTGIFKVGGKLDSHLSNLDQSLTVEWMKGFTYLPFLY